MNNRVFFIELKEYHIEYDQQVNFNHIDSNKNIIKILI